MIKGLDDSDGAYLNRFQSLFTGFDRAFAKAMKYPLYKYLIIILGSPITVIVLIKHYLNQSNSCQAVLRRAVIQEFYEKKTYEKLKEEAQFRLKRKYEYFNRKIEKDGFQKELKQIVKKGYERMINNEVFERMAKMTNKPNTLANTFIQLYQNNVLGFILWFRIFYVHSIIHF